MLQFHVRLCGESGTCACCVDTCGVHVSLTGSTDHMHDTYRTAVHVYRYPMVSSGSGSRSRSSTDRSRARRRSRSRARRSDRSRVRRQRSRSRVRRSRGSRSRGRRRSRSRGRRSRSSRSRAQRSRSLSLSQSRQPAAATSAAAAAEPELEEGPRLTDKELQAALARELGHTGLPAGRLYGEAICNPRRFVPRPKLSAPVRAGLLTGQPIRPKPAPFAKICPPPPPIRPWWH